MALSCNHYCSGHAISITEYEGDLVALVIQHAMRMRHIVICGLSGSTILSHTAYDFRREKKLLKMRCVFRFSLYFFCKIFLILRRSGRDIIINVLYRSSCEVPIFLSDCNETSIL